jgi:1A family penicillin-binding protein
MLENKLRIVERHLNKNVRPKAQKTIRFVKKNPKQVFILTISLFLVFCGAIALWISTFQMPDLNSFDTRVVTQSTKIYDRTGKILLYDVHQDVKRSVVPFEKISKDIKNATVAIEDSEFYLHGGIRITSIIRSIFANIFSGSFSQGGSTITQQVVKNSLLTTEKTISRKLKEWFLSIKLEKEMPKDKILSIYLNGNPYGGNIYGVEEASQTFFGKKSADVTLTEAAYLAAIPKAPTYYSPYGQNKAQLDARQKLVLLKMLENNFITQKEYDNAIKEVVTFLPQEKYGIRAPHFVEFIKQYLADKYGEDTVQQKGLKVITTLNFDLQTQAEEIVKRKALENQTQFNAENAAVVAIDPKTGQILAMVGSRDYFDKTIDGNFNVTLAHRQPGSTFKPFVYATAFEKGYTPDTVVFDVPTEFQSTCTPEGKPIDPNAIISSSTECYMPENYDSQYVGPINLRNALAQSRNIPAIKTLYLAGIKDSIETAKSMGIKSLSDDPNQYGLTLVLGGGEVSLLDMVSAYGVFANDGVRYPYTGIISIEDLQGNVLEQFSPSPKMILEPQIAETISDVLSDKVAKLPAYGAGSPLFFDNRQVASKTGTTNDSKDAWTIGYTPEIVVGAWAGNNNNTPMVKKVAGMIVAPLWHEVMADALASTTGETFKAPPAVDQTIKPVLRGIWQGNETYFIDKISGKLASTSTPDETKMEVPVYNIHSILYWVNKNDPLGPAPINPNDDAQFASWEYAVQNWVASSSIATTTKPTTYDDVHISANKPIIKIVSPSPTVEYGKDNRIGIMFSTTAHYPIARANFYLNNELVGTSDTFPFYLNFVPSSTNSYTIGDNEFKIVVYDTVFNSSESTTTLKLK